VVYKITMPRITVADDLGLQWLFTESSPWFSKLSKLSRTNNLCMYADLLISKRFLDEDCLPELERRYNSSLERFNLAAPILEAYPEELNELRDKLAFSWQALFLNKSFNEKKVAKEKKKRKES
jgi:hypothetical protein